MGAHTPSVLKTSRQGGTSNADHVTVDDLSRMFEKVVADIDAASDRKIAEAITDARNGMKEVMEMERRMARTEQQVKDFTGEVCRRMAHVEEQVEGLRGATSSRDHVSKRLANVEDSVEQLRREVDAGLASAEERATGRWAAVQDRVESIISDVSGTEGQLRSLVRQVAEDHTWAETQVDELQRKAHQAHRDGEAKLGVSIAEVRTYVEEEVRAIRADFQEASSAFETLVENVDQRVAGAETDLKQAQCDERRERAELAEVWDQERSHTKTDIAHFENWATELERELRHTMSRENSTVSLQLNTVTAEMVTVRREVDRLNNSGVLDVTQEPSFKAFGSKLKTLPEDLAEIRSVVHDLADVSRVQGAQIDELTKSVQVSRELQSSIGRVMSLTGLRDDKVGKVGTRECEHSNHPRELAELPSPNLTCLSPSHSARSGSVVTMESLRGNSLLGRASLGLDKDRCRVLGHSSVDQRPVDSGSFGERNGLRSAGSLLTESSFPVAAV